METSYENEVTNMINCFVDEALDNSETYKEAKLYITKRITHTELGLLIKKIAHGKIDYLAMNSKTNN